MRVCVERDIELDICDRCHGVWLDAGELTKLVNAQEGSDGTWKIPTQQECSVTALHCSRCSDNYLVKIGFEHYAFQGCLVCDGLFIDSETLDHLTSAYESEEQEVSAGGIAAGFLEALAVLFS